MLITTRLGIGCQPAQVLTGLVLNRHGNAITLSNELTGDVGDLTLPLRHAARLQRAPLRQAVIVRL